MENKIVLVTGANRGIGFAIVQALATKCPKDHYLLGCRSIEKGNAAIEQLHSLGLQSRFQVVELDILSDDSVRAAEKAIRDKYGKLDVLINNAGVGLIPKADQSDLREVYTKVFEANITSVALVTTTFLPLLRQAPEARVINVSSARGSFGRVLSGSLPPTASIPYGVSKTALNMLTLEYGRTPGNEHITFHAANPGYCRTEFNGFKGPKDPVDGAKVVVELVCAAKGQFEAGFYQIEGDETGPTAVPW